MRTETRQGRYPATPTNARPRAAFRHLRLLEPATPEENRFHRVSAELHRPEHWERLGGAGLHLFEVLLGFQTDSLGGVMEREITTAGFWSHLSGLPKRIVRRELARMHWSERLDRSGRRTRDPYAMVEFLTGYGYRIWIANPYPIRGPFVRRRHPGLCLEDPGSHARLCLGEKDPRPQRRFTRGDMDPEPLPPGGVVRKWVYPVLPESVTPPSASDEVATTSFLEEREVKRDCSLRAFRDGESVPESTPRARQGAFAFAKEGQDEAEARRRARRVFSPVLREFPRLTDSARRQALQGAIVAAGGPARGVGDPALQHGFRRALDAVQQYQDAAGRPGVRLLRSLFALVRDIVPGLAMAYNSARAEAVHIATMKDDRVAAREFAQQVARLVDAGAEYGEACEIAARKESEPK